MYQNRILSHFAVSRATPETQVLSDAFHDFAMTLDQVLEDGPEKSTALRKLLESRDCALRQKEEDMVEAARDRRIAEVKDHLYPPKHPEG